jgi:hypothetical protein
LIVTEALVRLEEPAAMEAIARPDVLPQKRTGALRRRSNSQLGGAPRTKGRFYVKGRSLFAG